MVFSKHDKTHNPRKWFTIVILMFMAFSAVAGDLPAPEPYDPNPTTDYDDGGDDDDGYDDDGYDDDTPTYTKPEYEEPEEKTKYVIVEREKECPRGDYDDSGLSYCDRAHTEHYRSCSHWGDERRRRSPSGRVYVEDEDGGRWISDDEWRDRDDRRRSCQSRYAACSEIPCHSRYSEFRTCERLESEYSRNERRSGRTGKDCYNCTNQSTRAENLSAVLNPLAYLGSTLGSAYLGYKGQKAQANAYLGGQQAWAGASVDIQKECTKRMFGTQAYTNTVGDRLLGEQNIEMMKVCNELQLYAGMKQGHSSNMFGMAGNGMLANGYSSGFLNGMGGPFAGANASLMAQLGIGASFSGGGSAGLANYPGFYGGYPPGGGAIQQGAWGPYGNNSAWGNNGSWAGAQQWQGQTQNLVNQNPGYQASMQFANDRNLANYMTGANSSQAQFTNVQQANSAYYTGMPQASGAFNQPNPSAFYQSTPVNYGPAFQASFSLNGSTSPTGYRTPGFVPPGYVAPGQVPYGYPTGY